MSLLVVWDTNVCPAVLNELVLLALDGEREFPPPRDRDLSILLFLEEPSAAADVAAVLSTG